MGAETAPHVAARAPRGAEVLVRAAGLSFGYAHEAVLRDVTLEVRAGEFVALVGPNGSGKSTLLKVLLGALEPQSGRVGCWAADREMCGTDGEWATSPSDPRCLRSAGDGGRDRGRGKASPSRMVAGPDGTSDHAAVTHAIESVGLADLSARPLNELSVGQQQRAFIARAFAGEPELLVLDEPIAGVDAESQRRFRDSLVHLIAEHGAGVLLVSHELSAVAPTSTGSSC